MKTKSIKSKFASRRDKYHMGNKDDEEENCKFIGAVKGVRFAADDNQNFRKTKIMRFPGGDYW